MIDFRPVIAVHRSRRIKKSRQQVSLDIPDLGCVPVDTVEHILNVHGAYFKQTTLDDLTGELVTGNTDPDPPFLGRLYSERALHPIRRNALRQ